MEGVERPQDWIIERLVASASTAPVELMEEVMADSRCPAFGPIHHFIVGATLLACRRNAEAAADREERLRADLEEMLARSSNVPGATCALGHVWRGSLGGYGLRHRARQRPVARGGLAGGATHGERPARAYRAVGQSSMLQARLACCGCRGRRSLQCPGRTPDGGVRRGAYVRIVCTEQRVHGPGVPVSPRSRGAGPAVVGFVATIAAPTMNYAQWISLCVVFRKRPVGAMPQTPNYAHRTAMCVIGLPIVN